MQKRESGELYAYKRPTRIERHDEKLFVYNQYENEYNIVMNSNTWVFNIDVLFPHVFPIEVLCL